MNPHNVQPRRRDRRSWAASVVLLTLVLVVAPPAHAGDVHQTHPVKKGATLDVEHMVGTLLVQGWDRDEIQIDARLDDDERVLFQDQGRRLRVVVSSASRATERIDLELRVPSWMSVRVEGHEVDVEITDVAADVAVSVIGGDVFVEGARGRVDLRSVHGRLTVSACEGSLDLESTNEDIEVRDGSGRVRAETVNGDVRMEGLRVSDVEISTTNGDVLFDGSFEVPGDYAFSTHSGDIAIGLPRDADLSISVQTWSGSVDSAVELQAEELRQGKRYRAILGEGRGRLAVESFGGDIDFYDPKRGRSKRG